MKQKTRIASKLFAALVVLTLISCCFLGTTMARYTTSDSGVASVDVARWNVSVDAKGNDDASGTTVLSFEKLSPQENPTEGQNGVKSTGRKLVATLKVESNTEVDVDITITLGDIAFKDNAGNALTTLGTPGNPSYNDCSGVFSIKFYDAQTGGSEIEFTDDKYTTSVTAGTAYSLSLYAEVTWTTWYNADDTAGIHSDWKGTNADKLDTWIGTNVGYVEWALSYTAVQGSELPTTPSTP